MPVTTKDLNQLRTSQQEAVRLARLDLGELWWDIAGLPAAKQRDILLDLVPAIIGKYSDMSSTAAADWYEHVYARHFDDAFTAEVENPNRDEAVRKLIRWKAGVLWDSPDRKANPDELLRYLNNLMDREIRNPGRQTIRSNARRDPHKPRYARVPNGRQPCAFCIMLASRGYIYASEDTADFGTSFHGGNCRCEIVPEWGKGLNRIEGYDPDEYLRIYETARRALETGVMPADLKAGLANIAPYREPKRGQSVYGPYDPNNVNSIAYLMRHMHPDKVGQGHKLHDPGKRKGGPGEKIRALKTMTPRATFREITHDEVNPLWDMWVKRKLDNGYRPDFSKNPWGINCQRVVQAAELRLRGYDVQAVGNHKHSSDGYYWNIADMWVDGNGQHRKFTQKESNNATIRAMREYPPGSRFFVAGPWKNGNAHIWNAEIIQMPSGWKSVRMYDYQPGDYTKYGYKNGKIADCYPDDIKEGQLRFLRVDDMEPTDSLLEGGRPSFTDAPAYAKPWVGDPDTVRSWSEWKLQRTHRDDTSWRKHQDEYDKWAESTPPSQGGQA
ncbi:MULTISPECIES: toxin glutamine deamidase domain-containing protein [unclassified Bifidobacterium]|uniref:VG15 protein n=1 Tax=unclassified Bifidobacterium TaxID=2608897 RepID=UPI0011260182|nr:MULTISPECIES: toxin glutamine deamidase domain-containing protein [unclassified Bifidobacterium]TPF89172.1 hypothetical protein BW10_07360 [Bifidobacterium sp. UTBIF-56]